MAEKSIITARLLIVSRESTLLPSLWSICESNSWQMETAVSAWDAIERIQSGPVPHLLVLDLPRGDGDGQHIVRSLRRTHSGLPVIVLCYAEDADRNEEAFRASSAELMLKPIDDVQLEWAIQRHLTSAADEKVLIASGEIEQLGPDDFFVCASPVSQKLRTQVQLLAEADVPVLILGEPGSGKDTVAKLVHKLSVRSGGEFVKVNCADVPAGFLDAELFSKGAAGEGRTGTRKFELADKGTIFFDEITEMPLSIQSRLMHLLQNNMLNSPAAGRKTSADCRVVAATSANMDRALAERRIREDLYYRLSAFTVQVPPLWHRSSEIAVLMQHLMHRLSRQYGLPPRTFSPGVLNACKNYSWPGNLKELESFVKRYLVVGEKDLTLHGMRSEPVKSNGQNAANHVDSKKAKAVWRETETPEDMHEANESSPTSLKSLIDSVKSEAERNAIGVALQKTGWNRKAAARLLQVSYRTLLYKIDQYQMSASQSFLSPFPEEKLALNAKGNGRAAS